MVKRAVPFRQVTSGRIDWKGGVILHHVNLRSKSFQSTYGAKVRAGAGERVKGGGREKKTKPPVSPCNPLKPPENPCNPT